MPKTTPKTTTPLEEHTNSAVSSSQNIAEEFASECQEVREDFQELLDNVGSSVSTYCRKRPLVAGLTVFMVGFYLGWKVKPW